MSKDVVVLAPNGRRQVIHCNADTSILQILEDACKKQGFDPSNYDLKHHNHILDLTTTIRFSNLPNKATLEMVEAERKRVEDNVTIGLLLEDGERRTAEFPPNTSLYDLINTLAAPEFGKLENPCILYMRQEVTGVDALRDKTLRKLGLLKGRAILRLLNKAEEAKQANVSAVYRVPINEPPKTDKPEKMDIDTPGPSHKPVDPVSLIKSIKKSTQPEIKTEEKEAETQMPIETIPKPVKMEETPVSDVNKEIVQVTSCSSLTQENLERRLNIEEEVTFLGAQKAIAFIQPEESQAEIDDLPDDFYDLTIEEVRKLYHDLQQDRIVLENTPLLTAEQRAEIEKQTSAQKTNVYKNAVIRIQFPDRMILQGVFQPTDTIQNVLDFIKEHLQRPDKKFYVYSTPLKENLDPNMTLLDARFVPCVLLHFKWQEGESDDTYLKEDIYSRTTTSDAAGMLASKYRAPTRRKMDRDDKPCKPNVASTSKNRKMPKWFKP